MKNNKIKKSLKRIMARKKRTVYIGRFCKFKMDRKLARFIEILNQAQDELDGK